MEYRYLKAFILTAKYLSFTEAAKELHIAQSAVSRQVRLLEESFEEELIIRSSKKVILTDIGKDLYLSAQKFDMIISGIFKDSKSRTLKIGILHGLLKNWFPPILEKYRKKYNRSLDILIGEGDELIHKLETGEFDIIFSSTQVQTETITSKRLFVEEFSIIGLKKFNLKDLAQYPWITYSDEDGLFNIKGKKSSSILKVDSISTMFDLVRKGLGVAHIPNHCLGDTKGLHIIPIKKRSKSYIYQTTLNYRKMPNYINDLTSLVMDS